MSPARAQDGTSAEVGARVFAVVDGRTVTLSGLSAGTGGPHGITTGNDWAIADGETFPTFRHGWAPAGVATRRQLASWGLRPGGADPVGRLVWAKGRRWADLYLIGRAKAKRPMTPARRTALAAAMRARRTCRECGRDAGYVIPPTFGRCIDCHDGTTARTATSGVAA